ncbi:MAG: YebC/PmpR family DNA-binding transcriptional regulator [bacterium]
MSGHSKWAQIKRQKGVADARRGTLYTKLANLISAAVREGGKDPKMNFRLRLLIDKARSVNMPSTTVDRAIKRGAGELPGGTIERVTYECYGPDGIACIVEAVTDNTNRTTSELRHLLSRYAGRLGSSGSVLWMFEAKGRVEIPNSPLSEEIELSLIDAGMADSVVSTNRRLLYTDPENLEKLKTGAEQNKLTVSDSEIVYVPKQETLVTPEDREQFHTFLDELDALDDITNVTTNAAEV